MTIETHWEVKLGLTLTEREARALARVAGYIRDKMRADEGDLMNILCDLDGRDVALLEQLRAALRVGLEKVITSEED